MKVLGRGLEIEPRGGRTVQRPTKVQTMRKTSNRQGCTGAKGSHHVHKGNDIKLITFFIMKTNYRSSSIAPYCWQRMLLVWSNFIVMILGTLMLYQSCLSLFDDGKKLKMLTLCLLSQMGCLLLIMDGMDVPGKP